MQEEKTRKPNKLRSQEMRARLIESARKMFVDKGFAETGTPEIVREAGVTRGALYHHFTDKSDLFAAVVLAEATAVGEEIRHESHQPSSVAEGMAQGIRAYFRAMKTPGRVRLMLKDGPAVLGQEVFDHIDRMTGRGELREGLVALLGEDDPDLDQLAEVLSAAFDRAALAVSEGGDEARHISALTRLIGGLQRAS